MCGTINPLEGMIRQLRRSFTRAIAVASIRSFT
jgi:hypothetical protein